MQTTELVSENKTDLKHKGKKVYEVTRKYCKNGWKHKTATITDLCTKHTDKNGNSHYKKIYP
jgi:hypothetical protein